MGWADVVTLAGVPDDPRVIDRSRLALQPAAGPVHPYGAAADAAPEDRARVLAWEMQACELAATEALLQFTADLNVDVGGVVVSRDVLLRIPIERVIASASLYHTASGAVYQQALKGAFENLGLPCATIEFGEAEVHPVWPVVSALGKQVGPPWRKDHKFAAVAAWVAATTLTPEAP